MITNQKTTGLNIAAGAVLIFFALQTVLRSISILSGIGLGFHTDIVWALQRFLHAFPMFFRMPPLTLVPVLLRFAAYLFLAVCAFRGRRDVLPFVGTVLLTLAAGIALYPRLRAPFVNMFGELCTFLAAALLAAAALMVLLKKGALLKNLWFLPAIPALISAVFGIGVNLSQGLSAFIAFFRAGGVWNILGVSVYLLFGLWLSREAVQNRSSAEADAAQKYAQVCYYYDLCLKGAITPEEYEAKRRQIEGF